MYDIFKSTNSISFKHVCWGKKQQKTIWVGKSRKVNRKAREGQVISCLTIKHTWSLWKILLWSSFIYLLKNQVFQTRTFSGTNRLRVLLGETLHFCWGHVRHFFFLPCWLLFYSTFYNASKSLNLGKLTFERNERKGNISPTLLIMNRMILGEM